MQVVIIMIIFMAQFFVVCFIIVVQLVYPSAIIYYICVMSYNVNHCFVLPAPPCSTNFQLGLETIDACTQFLVSVYV